MLDIERRFGAAVEALCCGCRHDGKKDDSIIRVTRLALEAFAELQEILGDKPQTGAAEPAACAEDSPKSTNTNT